MRADPAKAAALELIGHRQIHKLPPYEKIIQNKRFRRGIHLTPDQGFPRLDPSYLLLRFRREGHGFADAPGIVKKAPPQRRAETIPGPVDERIAGEPKVVTGLRCRGRGAQQEEDGT